MREGCGGHFPDCLARAVLGPERFRGRLLLRRLAGRPAWSLPRCHPAGKPSGDAGALAAHKCGVNASLRELLTGCVILELVVRQLEAHQMFERGVGDGLANRWISERVDGGLSFAGLARARENLADARRECR